MPSIATLLSKLHVTSYQPCPQCGGGLQRIHRLPEDRGLDSGMPMRRYRCVGPACDWQGLLAVSRRGRRVRVGPALVLKAAAASLLGLVFIAGASLIALNAWRSAPVLAQPPVAEGESHDGVPLPRQHPLLLRVSGTEPAGEAGPADDVAPLTMRQGCAWGKPGRNPYKGTPEQALRAARLPPEVVKEVSARIRARQTTDRVAISRDGIVAERTGQAYNPKSLALTYGHTLCVNARVNFPAGHVERADLYVARDARGQKVAVMVPDVCGNVSVLGARGERPLLRARGAGAVDRLLAGLGIDEVSADGGLRFADSAGTSAQQVPEPDSLLLVLGALVAGWWVRRRR